MKATKYLLASCLASFFSVHSATTITGQAFDTASMGLESGAALTSGVVNMGFYSLAPTRSVLEAYTSASSFLNNFTSIASGPMGLAGYSALFSVSKDVATGDASFDVKQIFILVGNGSTISNSTQLGVFTKSTWITEANPSGPTPLAQTFEISQLAGNVANILFGSYAAGGGEYPVDGVVNEYRLQAVIPEPSTASLAVIGLIGSMFWHRKFRQNREQAN